MQNTEIMSFNSAIEHNLPLLIEEMKKDNHPERYIMTKNNVLQIHHNCIIFEEEADNWNIYWEESIINSCECITLETRKNDKENIWYWYPCRNEIKFRVKIIGFKDAEEEEWWQKDIYEKLKEVSE